MLAKKYWYRALASNCCKSIADTHGDTADEKYWQYLNQYSKSIADSIGSNTNTAILTTLQKRDAYVNICWLMSSTIRR